MVISTPPSAAGDNGAPLLSGSTSTVVTTEAKGSHVLNIDGYSRIKKAMGTTSCTHSCTFDVGGHQWRIKYYPNGNSADNSIYISVYLEHVSPDRDVDTEFQFHLLNAGGKVVPSFQRTTRHTFTKLEPNWGWGRFIGREELEKSDHLKKDRFTIRCDLTVDLMELRLEEPVEESFVKVPSSDMHRHLGDLLQTQEGADVKFKVGQKTFAAHRYVLAARSPVLKAELFRCMKEKDVISICINDMDATVFKAMLHFIYTDELPEINEEDAAVITQHLLVAADRYDLGRLKLMCEDKLCKCLDVKMAATTLALAEQRHCHGLKKAIFRFLSLPRNMKAVMAADGYDYLMASCPSVCKELTAKLSDLWM